MGLALAGAAGSLTHAAGLPWHSFWCPLSLTSSQGFWVFHKWPSAHPHCCLAPKPTNHCWSGKVAGCANFGAFGKVANHFGQKHWGHPSHSSHHPSNSQANWLQWLSHTSQSDKALGVQEVTPCSLCFKVSKAALPTWDPGLASSNLETCSNSLQKSSVDHWWLMMGQCESVYMVKQGVLWTQGCKVLGEMLK